MLFALPMAIAFLAIAIVILGGGTAKFLNKKKKKEVPHAKRDQGSR